jgi:hypothetical protein
MLQAAKTSSLLLGHTAVSFWQFDTVFETNVKKRKTIEIIWLSIFTKIVW